MRAIATICVLATGLSGCGLGASRLNPFNWFDGGSQPVAARTVAAPAAPLAAAVVALEAAPTPGGVIVTATATNPTQGYWDAALVPVPSGDPGVLLLEFRMEPPPGRQPVGAPATREAVAGLFVSTQDLGAARAIAVRGATNQRIVRRQ